MKEKVSILHELNECQKTRDINVVKRVISCVDGVQSKFVRSKFCPILATCEKQ